MAQLLAHATQVTDKWKILLLEAAIAFPWCVRCECGYFVIRTASHGSATENGWRTISKRQFGGQS